MKIPTWAISLVIRILWKWIFKEDMIPTNHGEDSPIYKSPEKTVEDLK